MTAAICRPPVLLTMALALFSGLSGCARLPVAPDAVVQRLVAEDDQVRIEELRLRGQTQRLTVQPKNGARAYDIIAAPGGQDPSQTKGTTGQRVWPLLSF